MERVRYISRAALEIGGPNAFEDAIRSCVAWMRNRNAGIPTSAFSGQSFDVGGGGRNHAQAITLDDDGGRLWVATLDDPDSETARRTWVTELFVGERAGRAAFGARLSNVTLGEDSTFVSTRPGVVRQILDLRAGADGWRLSNSTRTINDTDEVNEFIDLLLNSNRVLPVVAISNIEYRPSAVSSDLLCARISGLAHIVELSEDACWRLTERFGQAHSVFNGAVRIYRTRFDPETADAYDHPLWLSRHAFLDHEAAARRLNQMATFVCGASVRPPPGMDFPSFEEIHQIEIRRKSERAKTEGASDKQLLTLAETEIADLKASIDRNKSLHDQILIAADEETKQLSASLEQSKEENFALRSRVTMLEAARREIGDEDSEHLKSYDDISDWAARNLSGSIWIAPKAIKETTKRGQYRDVALFGRALLLLRDYFVPMKREPGSERRRKYEEQLKLLRLEDEPCLGNRRAVRNFPAYSLVYKGEVHWCEDHIKLGGGMDPKDYFRVYYTWLEEENILLIGHMPTHLDNTQTN